MKHMVQNYFTALIQNVHYHIKAIIVKL